MIETVSELPQLIADSASGHSCYSGGTMKKSLILLCLLAICASCLAAPAVIGPSSWTIKAPVRYGFTTKTNGTYTVTPTLTVGTNGVMLLVQFGGGTIGAPSLKGADLTSEIELGTGVLQQLNAPGPGDLTTIVRIPIGIWYFAPPRPQQQIQTIRVTCKGVESVWLFTEGRRLNP